MARYARRFPIQNIDLNFVSNEIGKYMTSEGFHLVPYKGQTAWSKGYGFFTGPQYLILSYYQNEIVMEAFIKMALLPGVFVGEYGLDGFFGAIPKQLLKTRVGAVEGYIMYILQQQYNAALAAAQPPEQ